jgi:glutamyl-Q tRNA(Asp) synthetase
MTTPFPFTPQKSQYIGRFAPSPSGPLHFGSLVAALGSYLQAKGSKGQWLLRIEDIDPPRELLGASQAILKTLETHGLYWDGDVLFQSQQSAIYEQALDWLQTRELTYYCQCSRKEIQLLTHPRRCACSNLSLDRGVCATRYRNSNRHIRFFDQLLGEIVFNPVEASGDFLVKRKDQLYAYQLAVVIDDAQQGVSEVVRGADLLQATAYQLALFEAFEILPPKYLHLPVVVSEPGKKLSKQNHAPTIDNNLAALNITHALAFLGLHIPICLNGAPVKDLLEWAQGEWNIERLEAKTERIDNRIEGSDSI